MQFSIIALVALLFALGMSYVITRPIGDRRRHVAALLVAIALGFIAGVTGGVTHEAAFETAFVTCVLAAFIGALIGMALAWRLHHPPEEQQAQSRPRRQSGSRRPHYGISRV
jgi:predicted membrane-bound spermidine synthase